MWHWVHAFTRACAKIPIRNRSASSAKKLVKQSDTVFLPACGLALQERKVQRRKRQQRGAKRTRVDSNHHRKLSRPGGLCKKLRHIQWATGPVLKKMSVHDTAAPRARLLIVGKAPTHRDKILSTREFDLLCQWQWLPV